MKAPLANRRQGEAGAAGSNVTAVLRPSAGARRGASAGSVHSPAAKAAMPTGTLTKKIDSQGKAATSMPPSTGPHMRPSDTNVLTIPRARPRSCVGNVSVTIPMLLERALDAPTPCTTRAATSTGSVVARPHNSEPSVKSATPSWK